MSRTVIENAYIATVDALSTEYERGHVVIDGTRIVSVGAGPAPAVLPDRGLLSPSGAHHPAPVAWAGQRPRRVRVSLSGTRRASTGRSDHHERAVYDVSAVS